MGCSILTASVSVIIPTYNGAARISNSLRALLDQSTGREVEIIVVDDGSTDAIGSVMERFPSIRLIRQANAGPAAARNHGAREARGEIILFTDDDCVPTSNWLEEMLKPFEDPQVVGAKGIYRTLQKSLAARFVQIEYEDRYHLMATLPSIDFIDTYSAAFRRERFLEIDGYDTTFPVACAEDVELSYRMSARGWKMIFAPAAVVYHTHPDSFWRYLKKKYKFAFWRVLAVRKNPEKAVKDSHTPQIMKLQLLFGPTILLSIVFDLFFRPPVSLSLCVTAAFLLSTLPFAWRAFRKDRWLGVLSPLILAARACVQLSGVISGLIGARQRPAQVRTTTPA